MNIMNLCKRLLSLSVICAGAALGVAESKSAPPITFSVSGSVDYQFNKGMVAADFTH
jgi:hypothetical protein